VRPPWLGMCGWYDGAARPGAPAVASDPAPVDGASGGAECLGLEPHPSAATQLQLKLPLPLGRYPRSTHRLRTHRRTGLISSSTQLHPAPSQPTPCHQLTTSWATPRRMHRLQTHRPNAHAGLTAFPARRVAARESGKPMVDAAFGEVLVTCEKIKVTSRLPSFPSALPRAVPAAPAPLWSYRLDAADPARAGRTGNACPARRSCCLALWITP
jgi:hypothetical protein